MLQPQWSDPHVPQDGESAAIDLEVMGTRWQKRRSTNHKKNPTKKPKNTKQNKTKQIRIRGKTTKKRIEVKDMQSWYPGMSSKKKGIEKISVHHEWFLTVWVYSSINEGWRLKSDVKSRERVCIVNPNWELVPQKMGLIAGVSASHSTFR